MFKAIGFVIALIAIRIFLGGAFHAFENAAISFFGFADKAIQNLPTSVSLVQQDLDIGNAMTAGVSYIPKPAPLPAGYGR